MAVDSITELRVRGLRTLKDITLPLRGMNVLIGENGSGKSSVLEALELLRRIGAGTFRNDFYQVHGGTSALFRSSRETLSLGVTVEGNGPPLRYEIELSASNGSASIERELLLREDDNKPQVLLDRDRTRFREFNYQTTKIEESPGPSNLDPTIPLLVQVAQNDRGQRVINALKAIDVQLPFEVIPLWAAHAHDRKSPAREASRAQPTDQLVRLGSNLANTIHALRNEMSHAHWNETLDWIRLGLGDRVEDIQTPVIGDGTINLRVKLRGRDEPLPVSSLSDGTLAFLCFVALCRLGNDKRSILAIDEPELHLHPRMLARVMTFLDSVARERPVLLATHSSKVLNCLQEPARSAILCDLDETDHTTRLIRPNEERLALWLADYDGLGSILDAGYERQVMLRPEGE